MNTQYHVEPLWNYNIFLQKYAIHKLNNKKKILSLLSLFTQYNNVILRKFRIVIYARVLTVLNNKSIYQAYMLNSELLRQISNNTRVNVKHFLMYM